jgi:hypothetical protein
VSTKRNSSHFREGLLSQALRGSLRFHPSGRLCLNTLGIGEEAPDWLLVPREVRIKTYTRAKETPMNKVQPRISVDLPEKEAEGIYSNLAFISHSPSEFILDFARLLPGLPKSKVFARIVMTPQNAKALHKTLGLNIDRFENTHGEIKLKGKDQNEIGFQTGD